MAVDINTVLCILSIILLMAPNIKWMTMQIIFSGIQAV